MQRQTKDGVLTGNVKGDGLGGRFLQITLAGREVQRIPLDESQKLSDAQDLFEDAVQKWS